MTRALAAALAVAVLGCGREPAPRVAAFEYEWLDRANLVMEAAIARQESQIQDLMSFDPDSTRCFRVARPLALVHQNGVARSLVLTTAGQRMWVLGEVAEGDTMCAATEIAEVAP
jgi:hypothetical protein